MMNLQNFFILLCLQISTTVLAQQNLSFLFGQTKQDIEYVLLQNPDYSAIPSSDADLLSYYRLKGSENQSVVAFIIENEKCKEIREYFSLEHKENILAILRQQFSGVDANATTFQSDMEDVRLVDIGKQFYVSRILRKKK